MPGDIMILKCIKKHFFGISTQNFIKSRANAEKRIADSDSAKKGLSEKYVFSFATNFLLPSVIHKEISISRENEKF